MSGKRRGASNAMAHTGRKAKKLDRGSREGNAGRWRRLEEDSFAAALDFFHSMSLVFYFRDILPGVVFIDPQVLLDKVSELIEFMFELREPENQEDESSPDATAADNQMIAIQPHPQLMKILQLS